MANWLDKMVGRVRDAKDENEARLAVKDYIDPATGERLDQGGEGDGDTHVHVHLEGKGEGGGMNKDEFEDPNDPGGDPNAGTPSLEEMAAALSSLSQRVAQLEEGDEGEMELEDPDTKDARRFSYRRGAKMKAHDADEDNTPDTNPDMMGETDLPGIEDLDKRMLSEGARTVNITVADRRKMRDKAFRTGDSADMEDNWRDMVALAEIIQPGIRVGTFDARLAPYRTAERMCSFRRRVVDAALKDKDLGSEVTGLLNIKTVDGLQCDTVKMAFTSIGNMLKAQNNDSTVRRAITARTGDTTSNNGTFKPPTPAEMNKVNKEFWKNGAGNGSLRR